MGDVIRKALEGVAAHQSLTAYLWSKSDYFPEVFYEKQGNQHLLSTKVRAEKEGKWFDVHVVETWIGEDSEIHRLYSRFMQNVWLAYHFPQGHPILDRDNGNQTSERDRLKERYPQNFPTLKSE